MISQRIRQAAERAHRRIPGSKSWRKEEMFKLIYTSVPQGLVQGRSGFTTVAMTEGFPSNLITLVENLSGYRNVFPPDNPNAARNPVNCTYFRQRFGNTDYCIVSRIAYHGLSYTGRSNTLAVHMLFTPDEMGSLGFSPAQLLQSDGNFEWSGEVGLLPVAPKLTHMPVASREGSTWQRLFGDGAWARLMAWKFRHERSKPVFIAFDPMVTVHQELMSLLAEVSAWLTPEELVDFTYSTYTYQSSISNPLFIRAYPKGSPFLASILRLSPDSVFTIGEFKKIPSVYMKQLEREAAQSKLEDNPPFFAHYDEAEFRPKTQPPQPSSRTAPPDLHAKPPNAFQSATPPQEARSEGNLVKLYLVFITLIATMLAIFCMVLLKSRPVGQGGKMTHGEEQGSSAIEKPHGMPGETQLTEAMIEKGQQLSRQNQASQSIPESEAFPQSMPTARLEENATHTREENATHTREENATDTRKENATHTREEKIYTPPLATIEERMEAFIHSKGELPPEGWEVFLPEHYGKITLSDDMTKALLVPSPYMVACMESGIVNEFRVKLLTKPILVTTPRSRSLNASTTKWNPNSMELDTGYGNLRVKVEKFNNELEKCLELKVPGKLREEYSKLTVEVSKYVDSIGKTLSKSSQAKLRKLAKVPQLDEETSVRSILPLQDKLKKLREGLDALSKEEYAKSGETVKEEIDKVLGKGMNCTCKSCLFCLMKKIRSNAIDHLGGELKTAFGKLKEEVRKFPALNEMPMEMMTRVDEEKIRKLLANESFSIELTSGKKSAGRRALEK